MTASPDESFQRSEAAKPQKRSRPERSAERPSLGAYLALILIAWAVLAATGWIVAWLLGTARLIVTICVLLGLGFAAVAAFDYAWMRWLR